MRPNSSIFFLLLGLACAPMLPACNPRAQSADYPSRAQDPRRLQYVVGVADVLSIDVWKDPELSTEAQVRPDGTITMPLIGDLEAAGKTTPQLKRAIVDKLSRYVKDAIVTVAVQEVNSYRYSVTGEVAQPGMFTSRYYVSVSEAITQAGGPSRYAEEENVVVIRRNHGAPPERIPIDYKAILSGEHPEQDIIILAGDTVYVP